MPGPEVAAEYWHIGGIHTRLGKVSDRRVYGSKRALTTGSIHNGVGMLVRYPS